MFCYLSLKQSVVIFRFYWCWDWWIRSIRVQWWFSGESTHLPPMWPGFDSQTPCHIWVEFVGSLLCSERFLPGYCGFPFSWKAYIWLDLSYFQVNWSMKSYSVSMLPIKPLLLLSLLLLLLLLLLWRKLPVSNFE